MQIAIHAIGDQAVEDVLTWYASARNHTDKDSSNPRHRIEHAQHLLGVDTIHRLSEQQAVAVVNPLHLLSDMHIKEYRLGKGRIGPDRAFAYHDMLKVQPSPSLNCLSLLYKLAGTGSSNEHHVSLQFEVWPEIRIYPQADLRGSFLVQHCCPC